MKLVVVTSSRADYGLLRPFLLKAAKDSFFDLKIVATGSHLSKDFGYTYKEIENDKLNIYSKIKIIQSSDTPLAITRTCSLAIESFGKLYESLKPDAIMVLGDRYEIFCSVFAALFFKIPVIHYSGGEKTIGAYDDSIRHSISKMSHLHLVSCDEYRQRVIQLGENPKNVFNVGSLGLDNIKNLKLLTKEQLEASLNIGVSAQFILVSYYPETLSERPVRDQFSEVLKALDSFGQYQVIFTKSNADNDGRLISQMIESYIARRKNCVAFESLGVVRYLSAIRLAAVVVGNSSSGYTEVPSFNKPTVNIGNRQRGRVKAASIIDVDTDAKKIVKAITRALSRPFTMKLVGHKSPFGNGMASDKMIRILKQARLNKLLQKEFYDLPL